MLKKTIIAAISASIVATHSFAADPGFYMGGQLGVGDLNQSSLTNAQINYATFFYLGSGTINSSNTSTSGNIGLAGRLFAGYQFNPNWAAELGYIRFHKATTSGTASGYSNGGLWPFFSSGSFTENLSGSIEAQAVDLVAKAIMPLQNNFSLYGKLGLALLWERTTLTTVASGSVSSGSLTNTEARVYPTFGVGAAYDITPQVVADLSWNHIQKIGNATFLANKDLITAGLAYHFG